MRKGVADFWRNFNVGIAANRRYLDPLAAAPLKREGVAALDALCRQHTKAGRTYARFNPLTQPTWHCSEPSYLVSTPSTVSTTATSHGAYTDALHATATKLTDDVNGSLASS